MLRAIHRLPALGLVCWPLCLPFCWPTVGAANDQAPRGELSELVASRFAELQADWQVPGGVVAVLDEGRLVHASAHGLADLATEEPVSFETTSFRLASLSKPITAIAALRLVQQGDLELHASLQQTFPDLQLDERLTLSHLLTHTGGFQDRFLRRLTRDPERLPDLRSYLRQEMPHADFPPGTVSIYSNHGMALAGLAVAEAVGLPYAEAVDHLVFEPLGMGRATFDLARADGLARGYRFGEAAPIYGIKTIPASMLIASGADMAKLLEALLRPEEHDLLAPETVEVLFARHFAHHAAFTGRAYGWSENSSVRPRRLLHSGGTDGFNSAMVVVPERGAAVLVAVNGNAYVWDLVREILDRLVPSVAAEPVEVDRPTVDRSRLPGRYVPAGLPTRTLDAARQLFEQTSVSLTEDGGVQFEGRSFTPHGDDFLAADDTRLAADTSSPDRVLLFEEGGAWVKLPWHADRRLHLGLLIALLSATLLAIFGLRKQWQNVPGARLLSSAATLQLAQVLALAGFIAAALAQDGGALRFDVPLLLRALLYAPLFTMALAAIGAARVARDRGLLERRPALTAATVPFLWAAWLGYWNLLGVHV